MDTPTIQVIIPDCTATHVLGDTSILLASGRLSLIKSSSTALAAPSVAHAAAEDLQATQNVFSTTPTQAKPIFTLQIGEVAFPLLKDTLFGTDANNPLVYLFTPELGPAGQASQGGYVRLELPKEALQDGSEADMHQEAFERALIAEGLLKEGWEAAGDEIGRGARKNLSGVADAVDSSTEAQKAQPGTSHPTSFSPTTHSFIESSAQSTGTASEWTKSASQTVSDAATSAGKWIGSTVGGLADSVSHNLSAEGGGVPAEAISEDEEDREKGGGTMTGVVAGVKSAAKGIATGASDLASSISTRASTSLESNYGKETAELGGKAGETAQNVGSVAKDTVLGTSVVVGGGEAAAGAIKGGEK